MASPGHSTQVKTPERQQNPDVIDLITDSESEVIENPTTTAREYTRTPQRPTPRTTSTNSSATSSGSKYNPEVFDRIGRDGTLSTPSPNSSIGEEDRDIFQSDFKSPGGLEECGFLSTEGRIGQCGTSSKQIQTTKEAQLLNPRVDERKPTSSSRSRSRSVSRSGELTPRKGSPQPVEEHNLKSVRPRPRSVKTSLGSPSPRINTRGTETKSADTKCLVLERACKGESEKRPNPKQPDNSTDSQTSETIPDTESLPYPRFMEYKKSRKQHITNSKIIKRLMEGSSPQTAETKTGWIYVLESTTHAQGHVKIGKTVDSCSTREKAWGKCNFPIQQLEDINTKAFDHCSIVESLIMLELYNNRKKFQCKSCKGKQGTAIMHTEWFEIDQDTALKHVQKWRKWIDEHQPFSEDGKLTGYWQWKIGKLSRQGAEIDWVTWTDPLRLEKHAYRVRRHLERKDMQYWLVGFAMLVLLDKYDGSWRATLGLIALFVL